MEIASILACLVIGIPVIADIGYLFRALRKVTIVSAALVLTLAISIHAVLPLAGTFYITGMTWVFILMVASIYLLSAVYSYGYFKGKELGIPLGNFYVLMNLFVASMMFSLMINNYGLMWAGIEATTVTSALLIMGVHSDRKERSPTALEATWRYIIIVSVGLVFAFISIILLYYSFHTLSVSQILSMQNRDSELALVAVAIALVGIGTKVGLFPMHTWLPDAHSEAPAPVSALFSGVLLPTALYVLYMIYSVDTPTALFVLFGLATVVAASIFMTQQSRYKRMFAYSTMENMGIALLGFAIGGYGIVGAVIVLFAHSFGKAGAFYSSGNILHSTGEKELSKVKGLFSTMKDTSSALLLSSFAVTGTPPFGTFVGEFLIFIQLFSLHLYVVLAIALFFMMAAFISVNYNVSRMVFGRSDKAREVGGVMAYVPLASALVSLLIGVVLVLVFV